MRRERGMFIEPISHFLNLYYIINTLSLIVYLFLRESHTSLSQEQGWFGMSRETEMCFLFVLLMGKKIKYVLFISQSTLTLYHHFHQHSLLSSKHTPISSNTHFYLPSSPSFLSRRRRSLSPPNTNNHNSHNQQIS